MMKIFGNFSHQQNEHIGYLKLVFSPSSVPLKQRWRNNGLSANFLADYLTTFFPSNEMDSKNIKKQIEIRSTVSYVANELLENAMKFNDDDFDYPIIIQLYLFDDRIIFYLTNSISQPTAKKFQEYIQEVLNSNPQELYVNQLEHNAREEFVHSSRLGLLTMINDYMAKVGWKFETVQTKPEVIRVSTMVQLAI